MVKLPIDRNLRQFNQYIEAKTSRETRNLRNQKRLREFAEAIEIELMKELNTEAVLAEDLFRRLEKLRTHAKLSAEESEIVRQHVTERLQGIREG